MVLKVRARTVIPSSPSPWRRAASASRPASSSSSSLLLTIFATPHNFCRWSGSSSSYGRTRFTTSRFYWRCFTIQGNVGKVSTSETCFYKIWDVKNSTFLWHWNILYRWCGIIAKVGCTAIVRFSNRLEGQFFNLGAINSPLSSPFNGSKAVSRMQ